jgi:predicted GNAT family N-acyltransferase
MTDRYPCMIETVAWQGPEGEAGMIRRHVFIEEQNVPEAIEWDELDAVSTHFIARDDGGRAVGCARLTPDGRIGRMAVLPAWRGKGVGSGLLHEALQEASRSGPREVVLHAQTRAASFYARQGFEQVGKEFMEAGIPHVVMRRILK